jgi:hypothetical protein
MKEILDKKNIPEVPANFTAKESHYSLSTLSSKIVNELNRSQTIENLVLNCYKNEWKNYTQSAVPISISKQWIFDPLHSELKNRICPIENFEKCQIFYSGEFVDKKPHGLGAFYIYSKTSSYDDTNYIFQGEFRDGRVHGFGRLIRIDVHFTMINVSQRHNNSELLSGYIGKWNEGVL